MPIKTIINNIPNIILIFGIIVSDKLENIIDNIKDTIVTIIIQVILLFFLFFSYYLLKQKKYEWYRYNKLYVIGQVGFPTI